MEKRKSKSQDARCPSCGEPVELEKDVQVGDVAYCVDCDQELKVLKVNPPKLKSLAAAEAEDGLYPEEPVDDEHGLADEQATDDDGYEDDEDDADAEAEDDEEPLRKPEY